MKKLKVELTENNIRRVVTYVDDPVNPDKRISLDSVEYYETEKEYLPEDFTIQFVFIIFQSSAII